MLPPKDEDPTLWSLKMQYQNRDWYGDVGYDQFGRPTLYVKYECHETIWDIPDKWDGKQLLVHFAASVQRKKEDFMVKPYAPTCSYIPFPKETPPMTVSFKVYKEDTPEQEEALELSVSRLTDELDRLERICGSNILGEIFFEIHDKHNAVTNLSVKFPEVRRAMEKLYDKYGFDLLYDELEL